MSENYEYCILTDELDIIEYEKGLYKAFTEKNPDYWVTKNYRVIDGNRLKQKMDDEDVIVYAIKENNKIVAAGSFNLNNSIKQQFEDVGFDKPVEDADKKGADGLAMYVADGFSGDDFFSTAADFISFMTADLKKRGYDVTYGTCSREMKAFYTLMDFEIVEKKKIDGVMKYLHRLYL